VVFGLYGVRYTGIHAVGLSVLSGRGDCSFFRRVRGVVMCE